MKITLSALCLTLFMTGCVKTETVIRTQEVAAIPPAYLCIAEAKPVVPENAPPEERTDALLEAYAARGDVIDRNAKQAAVFQRWVELIKAIYPDSIEKPLEDLEAEAGDPE